MPHIILCGRYWRFSGDELPVTAVCAIIGRICVLSFLVALYCLTDNEGRLCHEGFYAYLLASMVVFSSSIVVEGFIVYHGLQGTMVEMAQRRSGLERCLKLHYAFSVLQLALTAWGLVLVGRDWKTSCATIAIDRTDKVLLTLVIIAQLSDILTQLMCCAVLKGGAVKERSRARGGMGAKQGEGLPYHHREEEAEEVRPVFQSGSRAAGAEDSNLARLEEGGRGGGGYALDNFDSDEQNKVWEKRCSSLCRCTRFFSCGIFGGSAVAGEIEAVARVMTNFFHHDGFLDVVPSDVLAGILLVRLQQRQLMLRFHAGELREGLHGHTGLGGAGEGEWNLRADGGSDGSPLTKSPLIGGGEHSPPASPGVGVGVGQGQGQERGTDAGLPVRTRLALAAQRRLLSPANIDDVECIRMSARMSQFAFAIYTHLLYLYDRPLTGACRLCYSCAAGKGCAQQTSVRGLHLPQRAEGDNCLHLHHAAAAAVSQEMGSTELVYASYANDAVLKPYAIFLDHETECVVVSIRGTLSLEDCLTDAVCEPVELSDAGQAWGFDGKGRWAHAGILRSAMAIRSDLSRRGVLRAVFQGAAALPLSSMSHMGAGGASGGGRAGFGSGRSSFASDRDSLDGIRGRDNTAAYPHYGITVVGHSLGAGTAVLLSLLLRAEYPTLSCYGFGTPGSLLDPTTADECRDWLTTVVLDNDIISRLGLPTLNHLREEVLSAITRAKVNKTYIMRTLVEESRVSDYLYPPGQAPASAFKSEVERFLALMRKRNETREHGGHDAVQNLVLPGRIIALVKRGRYDGHHQQQQHGTCWNVCGALCCCCCRSDKAYQLQETTRDAFAEIVVSPSMAIDHFPDRYVNELAKLRAQWTEGRDD